MVVFLHLFSISHTTNFWWQYAIAFEHIWVNRIFFPFSLLNSSICFISEKLPWSWCVSIKKKEMSKPHQTNKECSLTPYVINGFDCPNWFSWKKLLISRTNAINDCCSIYLYVELKHCANEYRFLNIFFNYRIFHQKLCRKTDFCSWTESQIS